jgi:cytoskeletal protein CcmA (bactofilin family)
MSEQSDVRTGSSESKWQPGLESKSTSGASSSAAGQSLIGPTVVIKGEVSAEEDLLVRGRVEGFIDHSATVTVHAEGTVAAEVKAQEVLVEGTVEGNIYGTQRVQIAETGNVNGNVYAPRVGVLEGASFKGAIDMDSDVDAIERRFREQTGTESKAPGKPANSKQSFSQQKEEANAAQDEEKDSDADTPADGGKVQ